MSTLLRLVSLTLVSGALFCVGTGCRSTHTPSSPSPASSPDLARLPRVRLFETNNVIRVELDGQLFTEYHFRDVSRPYLYPLLGVGDLPLTRHWPMDEVPGEEHDHPHHRSFWFTHGDVNGQDLWSEEEKAGRTVHQYFVQQKSGNERGVLTARNEWRAKDGKLLAHEERTYTFYPTVRGQRTIDFQSTVFASGEELVFGDTKEGLFAVRVAESMRVKLPKNLPGAGHLVNSRGQSDGEVWGKRAEWADYSGPVAGKTVGIAILDHPSNPHYPTWWHAREYGLFAANPFGQHDFESGPKGAGELRIPSGGSVTFRYRVLLHSGNAVEANVASQYAEYLSSTKSVR